MTTPKPLPCPLFPGIEPECGELHTVRGVLWVVAINEDADGYIEGPRRATKAEAITAWNQWMAPLADALSFREQVEIAMDSCTDPAQFRRVVADLLESIEVKP